LEGVTNNNVDVSVDTLRTCLLPQLKQFGIEDGIELKITKRGAVPKGGGLVSFTCPVVKQLKPIVNINVGHVKRIRGIAYATRVSPQMSNRTIETARGLLTRYIPDVYIFSDVYKGPESGLSPGYALTLVAETTTGVLYSAECAFQPRKIEEQEPNTDEAAVLSSSPPEKYLENDYTFPTPEDLGIRVARSLLKEIKIGGCVDSTTQWLSVLFSALGPEDVSKLRVGSISPFTYLYIY
jgi:RNA 3'-terminal phosphate cyclase-like protein